jgi:lysophospholipase L1-like esterase
MSSVDSRMRSRIRVALLLASAWFAVTSALAAEPVARAAPTPPSLRWSKDIAAFTAADLRQGLQPGGVLFLGSSSIRLWDDLETQFSALPVVIKRGFGGAKLSDCVYYLDRLVIPHRPRLVLVYAGENDLAEGETADEVLRQFTALVVGVHAVLPQTRIAFISIKPSPARVRLMPEIRRANALVRQYVATAPNADFVDVFTPMLDGEGKPRRELFRADALHLNAKGYALWKSVIAPHLN